jgi:uncharacterized protein
MPELELLDAYFRSDAAHPESMGLSDLDGFLTGIACSPEHIHVKEWLDAALGDADEVPGTVMAAVTKMYQSIRETLEAEQPIEPVFWETQDGTTIAMDWCEGFMEAVKMRPERWDVFSQTKTGSELMMPILVHMIDDDGNSLFGIAQEELNDILDTAVAAIPVIVPAIYRQIRVVTRN